MDSIVARRITPGDTFAALGKAFDIHGGIVAGIWNEGINTLQEFRFFFAVDLTLSFFGFLYLICVDLNVLP